ncbi:TetR/AcrR family transcriptional regulator [Liquorilactobacillus mali]|uniref:Transcriptional regulator-like protein n=1 Tax=Liquorilactobacillus mali KCTC 3596 = DSM 20444 TaxID=1046596 RepID=J1F2H2_9LACO|nr:TetR/AcrR family transcriptional regulator [Liquorilactobacillus mali]EJE99151.1 transcriptional regulator-like protein [Liquorilactobacillus mali KCTC 3596 = DSM 20444]KRN08888.1 transcriptional regulator-like protein [Liquorilactobacillus mali KCTC 3596 = DSM 20444]MDC7952801.1 TetR/AcrR family transcriptional regulator [Liquorilactobacillus mali]QFQ75412.1 TetR/AcrR family transcriptional regulator [Liquorilactobacillus mali]
MDTNERNVTDENKQRILKALLELLKSKAFSKITISEISKNAQISKRTFYRAFHSKEEVLASYGNETFDQYIKIIQKIKNPTFFQVINVLFNFWYQRRKIVKILTDQHLFGLVFEQLEGKLIDTYLSLNFSWHNVTSDDQINVLMQFMLGGITKIIQNWLKVTNPVPPVVITTKFQEILKDIQILPL